MSLYIKLLNAESAADLVAAANTFLATLTSPNLRRMSVDVEEEARRVGRGYRMAISYEVRGQVALTEAWAVRIDSATSPAVAQAAVQAFMNLNPNAFVAGSQLKRLSTDAGPHPCTYSIFTLYNTDPDAVYNYGDVQIAPPLV